MICIILCGSLETKLEQEIAALDPDTELSGLTGVPRALLPINGVSILDRWLTILREKQRVSEYFLVSNGLKYKYFERWATGHGFDVDHVVNNGCTDSRLSLGAVNDLLLGMKRAKCLGHRLDKDVMVVGADHLFHCGFSLDSFLRFYDKRKGDDEEKSFCFCYKVKADDTKNLGVIDASGPGQTAVRFWEKPARQAVEDATPDHGAITACPCFYILRASCIPHIIRFIAESAAKSDFKPAMGNLMEYLINSGDNDAKHGFYVMRLPSGFRLIGGSIGISEYESINATFAAWEGEDSLSRRTSSGHAGLAARECVEVCSLRQSTSFFCFVWC